MFADEGAFEEEIGSGEQDCQLSYVMWMCKTIFWTKLSLEWMGFFTSTLIVKVNLVLEGFFSLPMKTRRTQPIKYNSVQLRRGLRYYCVVVYKNEFRT